MHNIFEIWPHWQHDFFLVNVCFGHWLKWFIALSPRPFEFDVIVNNPFLIASDYMLQKRFVFFTFQKEMADASQNGFPSAHEEPRLQVCLWIQSYLNGHERLIVPLCNLSCHVPWVRLEHCLYFIIISFQRPSWPRHITPIKIAKMEFHKPPLALTYH